MSLTVSSYDPAYFVVQQHPIRIAKALGRPGFHILFEAGVATIGGAVRYPQVLIRRSGGDRAKRIVTDPVIVCEVVSPSSGRIDRH